MPSTKYNIDNKRMTSTWNIVGGKLQSGPTTATFTFQSDIRISADAKNIKVKFNCTLDGRQAFSSIKFGNTTIKKDSVSVSLSNVKSTTTNVSIVCTCKATAKTGSAYEGQNSAILDIQDVCFQVSWTGSQLPTTSALQAIKTYQRQPGLFPNSYQDVFIYDKSVEQFLIFDGVIKVQISNQVSIQDDTSNQKKKANYVNNAKDDADEITLQIMQSNVYTNSSKFQGNSGSSSANENTESRSAATYGYLYSLKQARRKVDVFTRLKLFQDFVIKSISVTLDENNTDGWSGTIVLHQYIAGSSSSGSGGSQATTGPINELATRIFGVDVIPSSGS